MILTWPSLPRSAAAAPDTSRAATIMIANDVSLMLSPPVMSNSEKTRRASIGARHGNRSAEVAARCFDATSSNWVASVLPHSPRAPMGSALTARAARTLGASRPAHRRLEVRAARRRGGGASAASCRRGRFQSATVVGRHPVSGTRALTGRDAPAKRPPRRIGASASHRVRATRIDSAAPGATSPSTLIAVSTLSLIRPERLRDSGEFVVDIFCC